MVCSDYVGAGVREFIWPPEGVFGKTPNGARGRRVGSFGGDFRYGGGARNGYIIQPASDKTRPWNYLPIIPNIGVTAVNVHHLEIAPELHMANVCLVRSFFGRIEFELSSGIRFLF